MDAKYLTKLSLCECPICVYPIPHFPFALKLQEVDDWTEFKRNGVDREYVENWSVTGRIRPKFPPKNAVKPSLGYCVFCKNNERPEEEYKSHRVRNDMGICECPVLRNYKCPVCDKVGGDLGHTIKYCPKNKINRAKEIMKAASNLSTGQVETSPRKRLSPIGEPVRVFFE